MKKNRVILLSFLIIGLVALFTGCGNSNSNKKPPQVSTKLLPPYLISFGSYLSWDKVNNATEYDIYCNQNYIGTTTQTTFQIQEIESDIEYYVVAKNGDTQSDKSNIEVVSKNCNFEGNETLNLMDKSYFSSTISSAVRKVIIGKDYASSFSLSVEISERTADLIFELHNVEISGSIFTYDGTYSRTKNNYNVIFNLVGDCAIKGNNGSNGFDFSDSRYDNSELDAGKGSNGGNAIVVPTAIITGYGNLTIAGGNGGNGGIGASTTTWEATNGPGKGADGGNGGAGIKTSYFILNMDSGDYAISVTDGKGGKKGTPGVNGSIITGPIASAMWNDIYDIGKVGSDGRSSLGTRKILKGKLMF